MSLFRAGQEDAFRVIHDRYRQRLFIYTRQMLAGCSQDAEDALQDIFVRAYAGLRASDRELALRAWLYRIAHNRCIDELRRPPAPLPESIDGVGPLGQDPASKAEQRDALRRLIADVQRLPDQQRSALLMRELSGMAYVDMAGALGVSVPAVKSLLVRARVGLAQASDARDTACSEIREDLIIAHDRGVRPSGVARRHMRDCPGCREFRTNVRGVSRQFAALVPALGPLGLLANFLGLGGGGGAAASTGAAAGGGAIAGGGAAAGSGAIAGGTGGAIASAGVIATGAGHVVTLLAAAVVTAGGAVEIQRTIAPPARHRTHHHRVVAAPEAQPVSTIQSPSGSSTSVTASDPQSEAPSTAAQPAGAKHHRASSHSSPHPTTPVSSTQSPSSSSPTGAGSGTSSTGSISTDGSAAGGSTSTATPVGSTTGTDGSSPSSGTAPASTPGQTGGSTGTPTATGGAGGGAGTTTSTGAAGGTPSPPPPVIVVVSTGEGSGSGGTTGGAGSTPAQ